jgi:maleylpyruvate isomerase
MPDNQFSAQLTSMSFAPAKLFGYFRSSAAYRVRIALNLKGLKPEHVTINLRTGEQNSDNFQRISPARLVPVWQEGDLTLSQSLAIIEYLEERHPTPPLLPKHPSDRAIVRELSLMIAADIHPIANLRVLNRLTDVCLFDDAKRADWARHWILLGLAAVEERLKQTAGAFCFGDQPTLADCCLIPQVYNARRFHCDLIEMPTVQAIGRHAQTINAFSAADPMLQSDAFP